MPAEAGIQNYLKTLDSRLRGNDVKGRFQDFLRNHQRWTFDVRRSSLRLSLYGINVTCECLQNNLAAYVPDAIHLKL